MCQAEMQVPLDAKTCAAECLEQQSQMPAPTQEFENLSDQDLRQMAREESQRALGDMQFAGHPNASLLSRFAASFLDGLYGLVVIILGVFSLVAANKLGVLPEVFPEEPTLETYLIFYFPVLLGAILQWNLIATRGQSVGKLICCIRIVTTDGKLPGFFLGVVMRNWVRSLLAIVPFFSLLDIAFIFGNSQRCIHDYLANTRVVQV